MGIFHVKIIKIVRRLLLVTPISAHSAYSAHSNKRTVWNNHAGYYIGLFGYYIKNYFLFNNFFEKIPKKIIVHARLFESAEYTHKETNEGVT